jgi:hypothetical protein
MSESTSILDLPTDPVGGGNISNGLSLNATENTQIQMQGQGGLDNNSNISLDQGTINQIVSSLQQASINGATKLSSRDIPMNTTGHSNDPEIRPNYSPPPPPQNMDYIQHYEQAPEIINNYSKNIQNNNSLDEMYNEIQTPLLIAVLYFLFQLPFFRKFLFSYFPILFSKDGNLNINGFLFNSILFGFIFYFFNKTTHYFNTF